MQEFIAEKLTYDELTELVEKNAQNIDDLEDKVVIPDGDTLERDNETGETKVKGLINIGDGSGTYLYIGKTADFNSIPEAIKSKTMAFFTDDPNITKFRNLISNVNSILNGSLTVPEAGHAVSADTADTADTAGTAGRATSAGTADTAGYATNAGTAGYATNAGTANTATRATSAASADTATRADEAATAGYAENAGYATNAGTAATATNATNAETATRANRATSADKADLATKATLADSATLATDANHATSADSATNATNATNANSADYATKALKDADGNVITDTYQRKDATGITGDSVGGWKVDATSLTKGDTALISDDNVVAPSILPGVDSSPVRYRAGRYLANLYTLTTKYLQFTSWQGHLTDIVNTVEINCPGELVDVLIEAAYLEDYSGARTNITNYRIDDIDYENKTITVIFPDYYSYPITPEDVSLYLTGRYTYRDIAGTEYDYRTKLLDDGTATFNDIDLAGYVDIDHGNIGQFLVSKQGIKAYTGTVESVALTKYGLSINGNATYFDIGNLHAYQGGDGKTRLIAKGPLYFQDGYPEDDNRAGFGFRTKNGTQKIDVDIRLRFLSYSKDEGKLTFKIFSRKTGKTDGDAQSLSNELSFIVQCNSTRNRTLGEEKYDHKKAVTSSCKAVILPGRSESEVYTLSVGSYGLYKTMANITCNGISLYDNYEVQMLPNNTSTLLSGYTQYSQDRFVETRGDIAPEIDNRYSLGRSGKRFSNIFAYTSTITNSDRNLKNTIEYLDENYADIFDALRPVSYKFNENTSDRTHLGFVAQEVKDAILEAGLTTKDFAGYCEWETENENGEIELGCGLRYEEFIALCVDQIQKLKKRVSELEFELGGNR